VRDLTQQARFQSSTPRVARVQKEAAPVALPVGDGAATVTASVPGGARAQARVVVKASGAQAPVSFHHEVIPILTRAGCSMGTCHGTPTGKGGFRLSLQGFAPEVDYERLTHEAGGRRANRAMPDASLILKKPLARVPHRGGQRFAPESPEHQLLRRWIAEGLKNDPPEAPKLARLDVLPAARALVSPARSQQLVVRAHFSDGSVRDVSHLAKFSSSDEGIAQVTADGQVTGQRRGEVAILCRYEHLVASARFTFLEPVTGFRWPRIAARNTVDEAVFAKLRLMRYPPSQLCSDAEFLRRATLDTLGRIPTTEEARAFLADRSPQKRAKLIDHLLRRPEFADFWAMKWSDLLRVREETLGSAGAQAYYAWIRQCMAEAVPLDRFARELITASGETASAPAANYYQAVSEPTNWMETTAQLFMGRRVQCAKCHNHPFDRITQDNYYALAAFFAQVKVREGSRGFGGRRRRERQARMLTVDLEPSAQMVQPRTGEVMAPRFPGGGTPALAAGADRREAFAAWLTKPDNPYFAPAMANRIWFHLMGRGIVEPVDDFRDTNPSTNDPLLHALARDLVTHRYDLRHLVRVIMNSTTYQLSARPHPLSREDTAYFSYAVPRLLVWSAGGEAGGADSRHRGQVLLPGGVRTPGAHPGVRMRAGAGADALPGAAAHQQPHGRGEALRRDRPRGKARRFRAARRRCHRGVVSRHLDSLPHSPREARRPRGAARGGQSPRRPGRPPLGAAEHEGIPLPALAVI
jgi:hypothetical protein